LALFSVNEDVIREEYDDLSDLNDEQMERVKEWEQQLSGKFHSPLSHSGKLTSLARGGSATQLMITNQ